MSDTRPEVIRKGEYYLEHGVTAYGNSDYVSAADFFNKALGQYRSIDDTHGILLARINLAETAMATGNYDAVVTQLNSAEGVSRRMAPPLYLDRLTLLRAQVYWREGKRDQVLPLIEPLLPVFDNGNEPQGRPDLLNLTALTLRTDIAFLTIDRDPQNANIWLARLRHSLQKNGDSSPQHAARLKRFEAQLAYRRGEIQQALLLLDEALEEYRKAAVRPAIAATLTETAKLNMDMKQWSEAESRLKRALYIRVWIMDRTGSREALQLLGEVYTAVGNTQGAQLAQQYAAAIREGNASWSSIKSDLFK